MADARWHENCTHSQYALPPDGTALGYTLMYFTHNHSLASQGDPRNSHGANVWKNTVLFQMFTTP